jgi:cytoskeletal protein CcmA (bactofilin family)
MTKNRNDLTVNGSMKLTGGTYDNAAVNGALEINGDLNCDKLEINGILTVNGALKSGETAVRGSMNVEGTMESEALDIKGKTNIEGNAKIGVINIEGALQSEGRVDAEKIILRGHLHAEEGCNAEEFNALGRFRIEGLLNAEKIECELYGKSYAEEIGGKEINVREGKGINRWISSIFPGFSLMQGKLIAGTIEGDVIRLENTTAKIVRGKDVYIGEGCDVMLVEYNNDFKASAGAKVKESRKI